MSKTPIFLCVSVLFGLSLIGCNNAKVSQSETPGPSTGEETQSVIADPASTESSPAEVQTEMPTVDSPPEFVCTQFMKFLQSGDRASAEKLLTRTASNVTNQADWQIPPLGGLHAKFQSENVRYATNKMKLAYVDFKIVERIEGKKDESEITWMMQQKRNGWRICGMLIQIYEDAPKDLISFENPGDVNLIKGILSANNDKPQGAEQLLAEK